MTDRQDTAPAGWYPEPDAPAGERYWDGQQWTDDTRNHESKAPPTKQPSASADGPQTLNDVSLLALILLGLTAITFAWLMVTVISYENKLSNFAGSSGLGTLLTGTQLIDARDNASTALTVSVVVQLVASLAFLPWFHRSYRNVARVGAHVRYGTGWAIGAWFVPILSLWRPKQI